MKLQTLAAGILLATLAQGAHAQEPRESKVPVFVERVFVPNGYDDNDEIEVVLDGILPSLCFDTATAEFSIDNARKVIAVTQFARRRDTSQCREGAEPSIESRLPVQYSVVINLGRLEYGSYRIEYHKSPELIALTDLTVGHATSDRIDEAFYAPVSTVFIPDMLAETGEGEVILSGVLPSNCLSLPDGNIAVQRDGNVIVIIPKLEIALHSDCEYSPQPLEVIVPIGKLEAGRYLLHVRKMVGRSLNRTFTVLPKQRTPVMN